MVCFCFPQWECKANMDASYRFGKIEVSCEGFDYPDDPYILKGSCGLEYTLELIKAGQQKTSFFGGSYSSPASHDSFGSGAGVVLMIVFVVFVFGIYKLFLCDNRQQHGFTYGDGNSGTYQQGAQSPPPPGFRSDGPYYQNPPPPGFKSSFAGESLTSFWQPGEGWGDRGIEVSFQRMDSDKSATPFYTTNLLAHLWYRKVVYSLVSHLVCSMVNMLLPAEFQRYVLQDCL